MIDVELPPGPAGTALVRGFAACLSSVTEVPVGEFSDAGPQHGAADQSQSDHAHVSHASIIPCDRCS